VAFLLFWLGVPETHRSRSPGLRDKLDQSNSVAAAGIAE
jgi:hypothetical protein